MKILFAAAEAVPFFKTGGLADVARALPDALVERGHDVRIILPAYSFIGGNVAAARADAELDVIWPGGSRRVSISMHDIGTGAPTAFVHTPLLFDTDRPYDEVPGQPGVLVRRFAFFCRAVTAYARHWQPDVVHLNDWQTGLVPVYALTDGLDAATLYSIHNLAYQGNFSPMLLADIDVPAAFYRTENGLELHGHASFMKGGIALADRLATVSPSYAREIQTAEYGAGLDGLLAHRRRSLHGVLNGIDTAAWNPATDPFLPRTYTGRTLAGKNASRTELMRLTGVKGDGPILGIVSRLAHQKGVDILIEALPHLIERGCSLVVLGSGDGGFEMRLAAAARKWPDRVALHTGFDEPVAHLIYAGADFFLMPSLYEPCGLGQMIAQRYGTPPIARRTGGLSDTVQDKVTGFLFDEPSARGFVDSLDSALRVWQQRGWRAMQTRCMREDHSWTRSAGEYERVYHLAMGSLAP